MKQNESAFPVTPTDRSGQIAETQIGLTKLEYFAGLAMQGAASSFPHWEETMDSGDYERVAINSVACAEALIAELATREKGEE